ncbi:MAG: hypothetical protein ACRYFS_14420 [Janthinobacterium lividum]
MDILNSFASAKKNISRGALSLAMIGGLSLMTAAAFADDPTSMAPPVGSSDSQVTDVSSTSADSVFNWKEVPADQQVPVNRVTFDQGGYQIYDNAGETIIVPFANQNLYVMKFAQSTNGQMYFTNEGGYPILYVPKGGYLENATVAGAHWYPFGQEFHPSEPVFLGIAPSYSDYVDMGWYPDMNCYGGYYGNTSFISGGVFLPTIGLFFEFGGHPYYGWGGYHRYYEGHPGFYHTNYYRHDFYSWAGRPRGGFHEFGGAGGHTYYAHRSFGGGGFGGGNVRSFRGTSNYGQINHNSYTVNHNNYSGGQHFGGSQNNGGRTFRGTSSYRQNGGSFGGGNTHNFSQNTHAVSGGQSFGGGGNSTFRGASSSGQSDRSFGGNQGGRSFGGNQGGHSFGGGHQSSGGGGHQNSGGGRQGGGGGGDHHGR